MIGLILAAAAGYVFGTKAGRERYEQIRKASAKVAEHPSVKRAVGTVLGKVSSALPGKKKQDTTPAPLNLGDDPNDGGPSVPLA
jgi:hypothetical protein